MAGSAIVKPQSFSVEQAVAAGRELAAAETLSAHLLIEIVYNLNRRENFVFAAGRFTHLDGLLQEHSEQGGRH